MIDKVVLAGCERTRVGEGGGGCSNLCTKQQLYRFIVGHSEHLRNGLTSERQFQVISTDVLLVSLGASIIEPTGFLSDLENSLH